MRRSVEFLWVFPHVHDNRLSHQTFSHPLSETCVFPSSSPFTVDQEVVKALDGTKPSPKRSFWERIRLWARLIDSDARITRWVHGASFWIMAR